MLKIVTRIEAVEGKFTHFFSLIFHPRGDSRLLRILSHTFLVSIYSSLHSEEPSAHFKSHGTFCTFVQRQAEKTFPTLHDDEDDEFLYWIIRNSKFLNRPSTTRHYPTYPPNMWHSLSHIRRCLTQLVVVVKSNYVVAKLWEFYFPFIIAKKKLSPSSPPPIPFAKLIFLHVT